MMKYTAADGIMLFYPFNSEKFSITLDEKSYAIVAGFIIVISILAFVWFYFKRKSSGYSYEPAMRVVQKFVLPDRTSYRAFRSKREKQ
jgi:hypothetical protein